MVTSDIHVYFDRITGWCGFFLLLIMKALYNLLSKLQRLLGDCVVEEGSFSYGNYIVTYYFSESYDTIEIHNPNNDRYLDNIAEWLLLNIEKPNNNSDEWNDNGFRDEADYMRYKFA